MPFRIFIDNYYTAVILFTNGLFHASLNKVERVLLFISHRTRGNFGWLITGGREWKICHMSGF